MTHSEPEALADQIISEICESVILGAVIQEQKFRQKWGPPTHQPINKEGEIHGRPLLNLVKGRDIYGQEKSVETKYFTCTICERQVAGSRFAAHVVKCTSRGRRPRTGYT